MLAANRSLSRHWRLATLGSWLCLSVYCILLSVGVFTAGIWAIFGLGLAMIFALLAWIEAGIFPWPDNTIIKLVVVFFAGSAILNMAVLNNAESWDVWRLLLTIFLPLAFLSSRKIYTQVFAPDFYRIIAVVAAAGAVLIALELASGGYLLHYLKGENAILDKYNRSLSYAVLMGFPIMAALWNSPYRKWTTSFFFALMLPNLFTRSSSSQLALIVGTSTIFLAYYWPRLTKHLFSAMTFLIIGLPFMARWAFANAYVWVEVLPGSWRHRVEIWDYVSYRIMNHFWLGWGLGSSRTLSIDSPHRIYYKYANTAAAHPHNMMGQLWVELGVFGLVMGILFLQIALRRAAALPAGIRNFAMAGWAAGFALSVCAYNLWTDSFFAALALTMFAFAGLQQHVQKRSK